MAHIQSHPPRATIEMRGPTNYSNWIVPGKLMTGALPLLPPMADALLDIGINVFVSLIEESEYPPHRERYQDYAKKKMASFPQNKQKRLQFFGDLTIPDRGVVEDEKIKEMCERILAIIEGGGGGGETQQQQQQCYEKGKKKKGDNNNGGGDIVYIHCYGGHGRSGVIASILLSRVFNMDADDALLLNQQLHDIRPDVDGIKASSVPSPQTAEQRAQVKRILHRWDAYSRPSAAAAASKKNSNSGPVGKSNRKK